jgi:hypothetical protein
MHIITTRTAVPSTIGPIKKKKMWEEQENKEDNN